MESTQKEESNMNEKIVEITEQLEKQNENIESMKKKIEKLLPNDSESANTKNDDNTNDDDTKDVIPDVEMHTLSISDESKNKSIDESISPKNQITPEDEYPENEWVDTPVIQNQEEEPVKIERTARKTFELQTPGNNNPTQKPKLINQGAYGCVFKPGMNCHGEDEDLTNYVTKIQEETDELQKEITVGKEIQQLNNFSYHYAPILSSCGVNIKSIPYEIVRDCKVMKNELGEIDTINKYVSNKIKYVGKYNMNKHILYLPFEKKSDIDIQNARISKRFEKIIDMHLYLLKSIQKMVNNNIIHFDLKLENIMYDDVQNIPIIIDFGLSFNVKDLIEKENPTTTNINEKNTKFNTIFFAKSFYIYWCVEIHMISQIVQYFKENEKVKTHNLELILNRMTNDKYLMNVIPTEEIEKFKQKYMETFSPYVDVKTWKELFLDIFNEQNYATWDHNSLCISIIMLLNDNIMIQNQTDPKILAYINILMETVTAMPGTRMTIEETEKRIREIFIA